MQFLNSLVNKIPNYDTKELKMTEGGIGVPLLYLSVPLVITNLLQTMYNLADTIWLGRYSVSALASISFAFPIVFFLISLGTGLSVAGSILVAQRTGETDTEGAERAASQTFVYSIITSLVLGVLGFFIVGGLLSLFNPEPEVHRMAVEYMKLISMGLVFLFGFSVFIALSRGAGDTITPMLVMGASVGLNIILDPLLIFGFTNNPLFIILDMQSLQHSLYMLTGYTGSGIQGAAIATISSRALAFIVAIYIMFRTDWSVELSLQKMYPCIDDLKALLRLGIPASVSSIGRAVSINMMLLIVGLFSTSIVAGYGVGIRILSLAFLPAIAVGQSVETVAGQNYGANRMGRVVKVNKVSASWMFAILTALSVIIWVYSPQIVSIFTSDVETAKTTVNFIRTVAPTFGFIGLLRVYAGGFRGVGQTLIAALIIVGNLSFLRLPIAYVLSKVFGASGIWLSFAISNMLGALIAFILFKRIIEATE